MKVYCKFQHKGVLQVSHELVIASVLINLNCECQHEPVFLPGPIVQHAASLHHDNFEGEPCVQGLVFRALC